MDTSLPIEWLSAEEIELPLRNRVGADARICGEWASEQFRIGLGDGIGTWRIAGTMTTATETREWSMVLKGWLCGDTSSPPSTYNWPWREAELYSSGVLNDLPGVSAPTCFSSVQRDDSVWVWLEDLTHLPKERWTLEHYATAGRLLGQFNGAYLNGTPIPEHRSLSMQWLAGWSAEGSIGLRMVEEYRHHPFVQRILTPEVKTALVHTWNKRHEILHTLAAMPQTFCHLDAFHANTFFRNRERGIEMVLIDWSFAGIAAVGEELAALCMAGSSFDPSTPYSLEEIENTAFGSYMAGLRDAGWEGDEGAIWHTYRSATILRYGPGPVSQMLPLISNGQAMAMFAEALGVPVDQAIDHVARHYQWIADHAYEV